MERFARWLAALAGAAAMLAGGVACKSQADAAPSPHAELSAASPPAAPGGKLRLVDAPDGNVESIVRDALAAARSRGPDARGLRGGDLVRALPALPPGGRARRPRCGVSSHDVARVRSRSGSRAARRRRVRLEVHPALRPPGPGRRGLRQADRGRHQGGRSGRQPLGPPRRRCCRSEVRLRGASATPVWTEARASRRAS